MVFGWSNHVVRCEAQILTRSQGLGCKTTRSHGASQAVARRTPPWPSFRRPHVPTSVRHPRKVYGGLLHDCLTCVCVCVCVVVIGAGCAAGMRRRHSSTTPYEGAAPRVLQQTDSALEHAASRAASFHTRASPVHVPSGGNIARDEACVRVCVCVCVCGARVCVPMFRLHPDLWRLWFSCPLPVWNASPLKTARFHPLGRMRSRTKCAATAWINPRHPHRMSTPSRPNSSRRQTPRSCRPSVVAATAGAVVVEGRRSAPSGTTILWKPHRLAHQPRHLAPHLRQTSTITAACARNSRTHTLPPTTGRLMMWMPPPGVVVVVVVVPPRDQGQVASATAIGGGAAAVTMTEACVTIALRGTTTLRSRLRRRCPRTPPVPRRLVQHEEGWRASRGWDGCTRRLTSRVRHHRNSTGTHVAG